MHSCYALLYEVHVTSSLGAKILCEFLACSTILFCASLSTAIVLQFWILVFPRSTLTSSSYPNLGLPILLTAIGLHSVILFSILSLSILTICPIHLILCAFIYLTISACLISRSISSLVLIVQFPSWVFIGLCIFLFLSFQTLLTVVQVCLLAPRFCIHMWLLILPDFYRCAVWNFLLVIY